MPSTSFPPHPLSNKTSRAILYQLANKPTNRSLKQQTTRPSYTAELYYILYIYPSQCERLSFFQSITFAKIPAKTGKKLAQFWGGKVRNAQGLLKFIQFLPSLLVLLEALVHPLSTLFPSTRLLRHCYVLAPPPFQFPKTHLQCPCALQGSATRSSCIAISFDAMTMGVSVYSFPFFIKHLLWGRYDEL